MAEVAGLLGVQTPTTAGLMLVAHSTNAGLMKINDDDLKTARMAIKVDTADGLMVMNINT